MAHSESCPICYGNGILRYIDGVEIRGIKLNGESEKQCHGCSGRGWIEVADEPEPLIQMDILGKAHKVG